MSIPNIPASGRLTVSIRGLNPEKSINKAAASGIKMDCRRVSQTEMRVTLSPLDYKRFKKAADGCKVRRLYGSGIIMEAFRLKRRPGLAAGLLVAVVLLLLSGRVFFYSVAGCEEYSEADIINQIQELGAIPGALLSGQELERLESEITRKNDLLWATVSRQGAMLRVYIKEKPQIPMPEPTEPCDIISGKTAVVERITVLQGTSLVKRGQLVRQGETLISGRMEKDGETYAYIRAMGEIEARVWYSLKETVPLWRTRQVRTGEKSVVKYLLIGDRRIKLSGTEADNCETTETKRPIASLGLPIIICEVTQWVTRPERESVSIDEASSDAAELLAAELLPSLPEGELLETRLETEITGDSMTVTMYAETLEKIGIQARVEWYG